MGQGVTLVVIGTVIGLAGAVLVSRSIGACCSSSARAIRSRWCPSACS